MFGMFVVFLSLSHVGYSDQAVGMALPPAVVINGGCASDLSQMAMVVGFVGFSW